MDGVILWSRFVFLFRPRLYLSAGERNFLIASIGFALSGALLALVSVSRLSAHGEALIPADPFTLWTAFAGAVGGVVGFLGAYRQWFGFDGRAGWLRAACGALVVTLAGSVIGGTLILPYYGTMFAPFQLIITMIAMPLTAVAWIGTLAFAHYLLIRWRAERESIFYQEEPIV